MESTETCQVENSVGPPENQSPTSSRVSSLAQSTTMLLVLCLINVVVYIKLLAQLLSSHDAYDLYWLLTLLIAITVELIGLMLVLCNRNDILLLIVHATSMGLALMCIFYLVVIRQYSLAVLIVIIVNVFAIWRFGYLIARRWHRTQERFLQDYQVE